MTTTEAELHAALGYRLRSLCTWLEEALEIGEVRSNEAVKAAKEAFLHLTYCCWDRNKGDLDGAATIGLEVFCGSALDWADGKSKIEDDLRLSVDPPWELTEFNLLVASALADKALQAFERGTKKQLIVAAILYADAVEAREAWDKMRGPGGARNPDTRYGRIQQLQRSLDEQIAITKGRRATGLKAAQAKKDRDPKQAAKAEAYRLWENRLAGKHPELRTVEQFAIEVLRRHKVLTSIKVVCSWSAAWTKATKQR